jgi:hypothetical protein
LTCLISSSASKRSTSVIFDPPASPACLSLALPRQFRPGHHKTPRPASPSSQRGLCRSKHETRIKFDCFAMPSSVGDARSPRCRCLIGTHGMTFSKARLVRIPNWSRNPTDKNPVGTIFSGRLEFRIRPDDSFGRFRYQCTKKMAIRVALHHKSVYRYDRRRIAGRRSALTRSKLTRRDISSTGFRIPKTTT